MRLQERYAARSIRFLELWQCADWRIKLYGLAYRASSPCPELVIAAKRLVATCLSQPAVTKERYGVGFAGVHQGRGSNLVFVGWWANENELFHHAWISTPANAESFTYVSATGLAACVWDLALIDFERRAWISSVLSPRVPSVGRYLELRFEGQI